MSAPRPLRTIQAPTVDTGQMQEDIGQVNDIFLGIIQDSWDGRPSAGNSARENAFAALTMMWIGVGTGVVATPVAGAFAGGGAGALFGGICASPAFGVGAAAGAGIGGLAGTALGTGTGIAASVGLAITASVVTVPLYLEIDKRYPDKTASAGINRSPGLLACATTNGQRVLAPSKYAGQYESFFIHLIDNAIGDGVLELAKSWDQASGLTKIERQTLGDLAFLKPTMQKIAYVKKYGKMSANSKPAQPLQRFLQDAQRWIAADEATVRDGWIAALGLGELDLRASKGKLTLKTSSTLKSLGFPAQLTQSLPSAKAKFPSNATGGTMDPYVRVSLAPGKFDVNLGKASIIKKGKDRDKLQVTFKVKKGAKLLNGEIRHKWNNQKEAKLGLGLAPKLTSDLTGKVILRVAGHGLEVDRIEIGQAKLSLGTPKLEGPLTPLQGIVDSLAKSVASEVKKFVKQLGVEKVLSDLLKKSSKGLETFVREHAQEYGVYSVKDILALEIRKGQLRVKARVEEYGGPSLASLDTVTQEAKRRLSKPKLKLRPGGLKAAPLKPVPKKKKKSRK